MILSMLAVQPYSPVTKQQGGNNYTTATDAVKQEGISVSQILIHLGTQQLNTVSFITLIHS